MSCLIVELKKLKESSIEAVETLSSFNDFKQYMHIKRDIEDELLEVIKGAKEKSGPQLVMVCGGVGDGKSHLISYLKNTNNELFRGIKLHNDATESTKPTMTAMETLREVLSPYNDMNINNGSDEKLIIAINLGTMNNFINSKESEGFEKLKLYIDEKKILDAFSINTKENDTLNSNYHFVNFSDYQLYSLDNNGTQSKYLEDIMGKVFDQVPNNPFYDEYNNSCLECESSNICPVKYNYEFLLDKNNKDILLGMIIEMMVKYKTILSTRSFFNFIYEILVAQQIDSLPENIIVKKIKNFKFEEIIDSLIKSIIFEHRQTNRIFKDLANLDPLKNRKKELDEMVIKFNTREINLVLSEYGVKDNNSFLMNLLKKSNYSEVVVRYILRSIEFSKNEKSSIYEEYLTNLFFINQNPKKAKRAFRLVKQGIYDWNGKSKNSDEINVFPGKKQLRYRVSKKFEIKPYVQDIEREDKEIKKFYPDIVLSYKTSKEVFKFTVDYFLYELLTKIEEGYKPNKNDYSQFINFSNTIKKMTDSENQEERVVVEDRLNNFVFSLEYDDFGELIIDVKGDL